jgi:error-prone DNA polymerase
VTADRSCGPGCRNGAVRTALAAEGPDAGFAQLHWLVDRFGAEHVVVEHVVELTDHQNPVDSTRNDRPAEMAAALDRPTIATLSRSWRRGCGACR